MRFLCCGPDAGVDVCGDPGPSGTPSLGLRCTGVLLGVGDLLIFFSCGSTSTPAAVGRRSEGREHNTHMNTHTLRLHPLSYFTGASILWGPVPTRLLASETVPAS